MADELWIEIEDTRAWESASEALGELLAGLVEAPGIDPHFARLSALDDAGERLLHENPLEGPALHDVVAAIDPDVRGVRIGGTFACDRLHSGSPEPGCVGFWAEAQDERAHDWPARWRLRLWSAGPFCAPLTATGPEPGSEPVLAAVRRNVDALLGLCFHLLGCFEPQRMRVFAPSGAQHLANYQALWFRTPEQLVDEVERLVAALDSAADDELTLHGWRDAQQSAALAAQLRELLPRLRTLDPERVRALLAQNRFDRFDVAGGTLVLEHPWICNAFLDRLVLELGRSE